MKISFAFLFSAAVVADVCGEADIMAVLQSPSHVVRSHPQQSCTTVVAGQMAPINGVFTATDASKVDYRANRGDVAQSAGRFCVDETTVSMLQRAFSVSDVSEFDVLLQKKSANPIDAIGTIEGSVAGKTVTTTTTTKVPVTMAPSINMDVTLGPFPGYSGDLNVTGIVWLSSAVDMTDRQNVSMRWSMQGLEGEACAGPPPPGVANACGIHIHRGKTCEDMSAIQGHYYDADYMTEDPWSPVSYSTIPNQGDLRGEFWASTGNLNGNLTVVPIGTTFSSIEGRVLVVHDSTGGRVACGLISLTDGVGHLPSAFYPKWYTCRPDKYKCPDLYPKGCC